MRIACLTLVGAVALFLTATDTQAQIKLVTPYYPGSNSAAVATIVGQAFATALGKTVDIQHAERGVQFKTAKEAINRAGDGNTLLIADLGFLNFYKSENAGNGILEEGTTVGVIGEQRLMLIASRSNGLKSVSELRRKLAADRSSIGYLGFNAISTRCAADIKSQSNRTDTGITSFPATADLLAALDSGAVTVACTPFSRSIALSTQLLAISGHHEFPDFENASLFANEGIPLPPSLLVGVFAPRSTPQPIVDQYSAALSRILDDKATRRALSAAGVVPDVQHAVLQIKPAPETATSSAAQSLEPRGKLNEGTSSNQGVTFIANNGDRAAVVNGVVISASEVDTVFLKSKRVSKAAILNALIDTEVVAQELARADETFPRAALEAIPPSDFEGRRNLQEIYTRRYLEKIGSKGTSPTPAEISNYYVKHPALFRKRKVYRLQRVDIDTDMDIGVFVEDAFNRSPTANDFLDILRKNGYKFATADNFLAGAEQLPLDIIDAMQTADAGKAFVHKASLGYEVFIILGVTSQPVTVEVASPAIKSFLLNDRKRILIEQEVSRLRTASTIQRFGEFNGQVLASTSPSRQVTASSETLVSLDGVNFKTTETEKRAYEAALALIRSGNFAMAVKAFSEFMSRYPESGYTDSSAYWLASAQYAQRNYRDAIATSRKLIEKAPRHPKVPEALLTMAYSYREAGDKQGAARTFAELKKHYPDSEAAKSLADSAKPAQSPEISQVASPAAVVVTPARPTIENDRASVISTSVAVPTTYRDACSDGGFTMSVVTATGRSLERDAPFNRVPKSAEGAAVCNLEQYFGKDPIRQRVADFHVRTNYAAPAYKAVMKKYTNPAGIGDLGEDFILTGPSTDFTFKIRYRYRDFKGCGDCAPGSTVNVTADVNIEGWGTLGGEQYANNYSESIIFKFVVRFVTP